MDRDTLPKDDNGLAAMIRDAVNELNDLIDYADRGCDMTVVITQRAVRTGDQKSGVLDVQIRKSF